MDCLWFCVCWVLFFDILRIFLWYLILSCFLRAVCKKFGLHVSRLMLAFLVLSTGMFCSSAGKCA